MADEENLEEEETEESTEEEVVEEDDGEESPLITQTKEINRLKQRIEVLKELNEKQRLRFKDELKTLLRPLMEKHKSVQKENVFLKEQIRLFSESGVTIPGVKGLKIDHQEKLEELYGTIDKYKQEIEVLQKIVNSMEKDNTNARREIAELTIIKESIAGNLNAETLIASREETAKAKQEGIELKEQILFYEEAFNKFENEMMTQNSMYDDLLNSIRETKTSFLDSSDSAEYKEIMSDEIHVHEEPQEEFQAEEAGLDMGAMIEAPAIPSFDILEPDVQEEEEQQIDIPQDTADKEAEFQEWQEISFDIGDAFEDKSMEEPLVAMVEEEEGITEDIGIEQPVDEIHDNQAAFTEDDGIIEDIEPASPEIDKLSSLFSQGEEFSEQVQEEEITEDIGYEQPVDEIHDNQAASTEDDEIIEDIEPASPEIDKLSSLFSQGEEFSEQVEEITEDIGYEQPVDEIHDNQAASTEDDGIIEDIEPASPEIDKLSSLFSQGEELAEQVQEEEITEDIGYEQPVDEIHDNQAASTEDDEIIEDIEPASPEIDKLSSLFSQGEEFSEQVEEITEDIGYEQPVDEIHDNQAASTEDDGIIEDIEPASPEIDKLSSLFSQGEELAEQVQEEEITEDIGYEQPVDEIHDNQAASTEDDEIIEDIEPASPEIDKLSSLFSQGEEFSEQVEEITEDIGYEQPVDEIHDNQAASTEDDGIIEDIEPASDDDLVKSV